MYVCARMYINNWARGSQGESSFSNIHLQNKFWDNLKLFLLGGRKDVKWL